MEGVSSVKESERERETLAKERLFIGALKISENINGCRH